MNGPPHEPEKTTPAGTSRPEPTGSGGAVPSRPGAELVDSDLLQEISLLADVIASVSGVGSHLSHEQVDAVLGVPPIRPLTPSPARALGPWDRVAHPAVATA